ncbi:hypothetical protein GPJ56_001626 [Histomonas meleagridis]|uniref:uncharacterized protein n=1 Tax=Histomonas meleagridis TaxID=135588 RepID=UPI00355950AB|nr:hypothetical protein GPJ56_001626 [Histomonas meleagridis]KAH0807132.1 hypothetical protein GO595_000308 [Histomonas meleagridis]
MTEEAVFRIAPLPTYAPKYMTTKAITVGKNVVDYIKKSMGVTVPEAFIQSCDQLDQLRITFSSKYETIENVAAFADYNHLLRSVTKDVNLEEAKISFKWDKGSGGVDFEICCMGCNIVNGLLASASQISLSELAGLQPFVSKIVTARGIMNKLLEMYDPSFAPTLKEDYINNISCYIDAFYAHATVATIALKSPTKYVLYSRVAKAASEKYQLCSQIPYSIYFDVLANVRMSENCIEGSEYGKAIAYGTKAQQLIPSTLSSKEKKTAQKLVDTIFAPFRAKFDQCERDNTQLYLDPIPKELDEIQPAANQCPPKFNWESTAQVSPIQDSISGSSNERINQKFENIKSQTTNCMRDIDAFLAQSPATFTRDISEIQHQMATVRNEVQQIARLVEDKLRVDHQRIQQGYPNAYTHYNTLAPLLGEAVSIDQIYEQEINRINEVTKRFEGAPQRLNSAKNDIQLQITHAQQIFDDAMGALQNESNAQAIMSIAAKACNDLDGVMSALNPIFDFVQGFSCDLQRAAEECPKMGAVVEGLKGGVVCYERLRSNFSKMVGKIESV